MESIITTIIKALASIFPTVYLDRFKKNNGDKHLPASDAASELGLLRSYVALIKPDTRISDTHADIITANFKDFERDFNKLVEANDWRSIIKIKVRLREYFEYSGLYEKGVEFGVAYEKALRKEGMENEAIWSLIKDIGYMLVLSGKHAKAREVLQGALNKLKNLPELFECKFYCYRYLGIAYFRDSKIDGVNKAKENFALAEKMIQKFDKNSNKEKELKARICGNKGNLSSYEGKCQEALNYYNQSLQLFQDIEDQEHIGISMLQIVQHLILSEKQKDIPKNYLNKAKVIFTQIGWIEGLARVDEQYSRYYYLSAKSDTDYSNKQSFKDQALDFAKTSEAHFVQVNHKSGIERIQELKTQIMFC